MSKQQQTDNVKESEEVIMPQQVKPVLYYPTSIPRPNVYPTTIQQPHNSIQVKPVEMKHQKIPLLSEHSTQYESCAPLEEEDELVDKNVPVKSSGCWKWCGWCCCGWCCLFACMTLCSCCLLLMGGAISGAYWGAQYYHCVNDKVVAHKTVYLNDTITALDFQQWGDFSLEKASDGKFMVDLTTYLYGDYEVSVTVDENAKKATFSIPKGYQLFNELCLGFHAVVSVPESVLPLLTVEMINRAGSVEMKDVQLESINAEVRNGEVDLSGVKVESLDLVISNAHATVNDLAVSGDVDLDCSNSYSEFKDVAFNGSVSLDISNSRFSMDCIGQAIGFVSFNKVSNSVLSMIDCKLLAEENEHVAVKMEASNSRVKVQDLVTEGPNWAQVQVSDLGNSDFSVNGGKFVSFVLETVGNSDVEFTIEPDYFGESALVFDFNGGNSNFKAVDTTSSGFISIETHKDDHLKGTVNKGGEENEHKFHCKKCSNSHVKLEIE